MLDQEAVARLSAALVARAGGYLRNPTRLDGVTCQDCTTPVDGYKRCYVCHGHWGQEKLADRIAVLTYAIAGQQSGYVMRGYKAPRPLDEHRAVVALLVLVAIWAHRQCPAVLAGSAVTHWSVVPSLPRKAGSHPRVVNADHFRAQNALPSNSHVLLMDDTWATGGHAQSAALALRKAGAAHVSLLVVARWLKPDFGDNAKFLRDYANKDYDPVICPWTGGACPREMVTTP